MHYAPRVPFVMDEKIGVVFESLSSTEFCEVSAQLVDFQPGDIARKVLDVGADVAQTTSGSGFTRIVSPDLVLVRGLQWVQSPALRVFGDDFKNFVQFPATPHLGSLFHHWVTCVAVGQREHLLRFRDKTPKLKCLAKIERHRLFTNNVETDL